MLDTSERVKQDITYTDGAWDTSKYDADPEIPGQYRLYIITKDGFVIDRWRPIPGYLDTSNFKQLLEHGVPSTQHTVTGQEWRVLSKPLPDADGNTVGVVAVGRFGAANDLASLDAELSATAESIVASVKVNGADINADGVNIRGIPFNISFQIVDQYNTIQLKSDNASSIDRIPNFIDPSYVSSQLKKPGTQWIRDGKSGELFLVRSMPLTSSSGTPVGVVIAARTVSPVIGLLKTYAVLSTTLCVVLCGVAVVLLAHRLQAAGRPAGKEAGTPPANTAIRVRGICFSKQDSILRIDGHTIGITYASNQYYLCAALFSAPKKKWEASELLEKFGAWGKDGDWRKVYDAMAAINKKVAAALPGKLIIVSNKTYRINPEFVENISKKQW